MKLSFPAFGTPSSGPPLEVHRNLIGIDLIFTTSRPISSSGNTSVIANFRDESKGNPTPLGLFRRRTLSVIVGDDLVKTSDTASPARTPPGSPTGFHPLAESRPARWGVRRRMNDGGRVRRRRGRRRWGAVTGVAMAETLDTQSTDCVTVFGWGRKISVLLLTSSVLLIP